VELEDLVAELRAEGVATRLGPGASSVTGDAVLLRLALRALVDQARLGEPEGSALEIQARAEAGQVRISVTDREGEASEGFPLEQQARPALPRNEESLALVRRIAELHGGSLTLESGGAAPRYTLTLVRA
jgi:signal transduction histidine kinase